jgi:ABC-type uncharacterized transport system substrate-binding protein
LTRSASRIRTLRGRTWSLRALLWLVLAWAPAAAAADYAVLLSRAGGAYDTFFDVLRTGLPQTGAHRLDYAGSLDGESDEAILGRAHAYIAVGAEAAERLAARGDRPILAVMVSSQGFRDVQAHHPRSTLSAIVLDQPLDRQMRLIRALLPKAERVGILLGPSSDSLQGPLVAAAGALDLVATITRLDDDSQLIPALRQLLQTADVMLAVPDPVASNSTTARPILLTTYSYGRPLIAYSRAYVQAGALAAVYSSPADVARQVGEWMANQPTDGTRRSTVETPRYFSVAINRQVARALMLDPPDEATLAAAIKDKQP